MKIEPRGKYAGVKVHLDGDEAMIFSRLWKNGKPDQAEPAKILSFAIKLGGKINTLLKDMPNLLEDRTKEQIQEALLGDQAKIKKQLDAMKTGSDWKKVL